MSKITLNFKGHTPAQVHECASRLKDHNVLISGTEITDRPERKHVELGISFVNSAAASVFMDDMIVHAMLMPYNFETA